MAHTPGPWHWNNGTLLAGPNSANGIHLLYTSEAPGLKGAAEANAHLIAAAPDLLSELRRDLSFVREMKTALKTAGWSDTVQFTHAEMREHSLVAAIAKAEGK